MTRRKSSGKSMITKPSLLDASRDDRNCDVQVKAAEKEKAENEDALGPTEKVLLTPPKATTTIPASMEKEKERAKANGRAEKKKPTLLKAKARAKTKARVKENPLQKAVSPSRQKARPRSQNKLQQQPPLPQRTGVGTPKRTGRRGKKVHTLQRTIKTKARESPREAKTRKSYVYKEEAQMDQCTQKQTRNKKFQNK